MRQQREFRAAEQKAEEKGRGGGARECVLLQAGCVLNTRGGKIVHVSVRCAADLSTVSTAVRARADSECTW